MSLRNHFIQIYLQKLRRISLPIDLIRYAKKRNTGKIFIIDGERNITFEEIYERAKRFANALYNMGFKQGEKLAILIYNCAEYFEIRVATYMNGVVLIPLFWDLEVDDIIYILNLCNTKGLIYHPEIINENIHLIKERTDVRHFIALGNGNQGCYEDFIRQANPSEPKVRLKESDLASINFSSGTTGPPKGVMLTQTNWISSFYNYLLNSNLSLGRELRVLHLIPFSLAGSTAILPSMAACAKNIIMKNFNPEKVVHLINDYKVNRIFITPGWFIELLQYCKEKGIKPLSLERIIVGTDPLSIEKFKEGIDFFGPILEIGYGMAEVLPPISLLSPHDYLVKGKLNDGRLSSVGKPIKEVSVKIISQNDNKILHGQIGRIAIKSLTRSKGYWNNHELTRQHYREDWYFSEDYGYIDEEGYLYILGRKGDIIGSVLEKTSFTRQIEEILHTHPAVLEAYVFHDSKKGLGACVSLRGNLKDLSKEILLNFCERNSSKNLVPNFLKIYPNLAKTAAGKIDRKRIQREIQEGK